MILKLETVEFINKLINKLNYYNESKTVSSSFKQNIRLFGPYLYYKYNFISAYMNTGNFILAYKMVKKED